MNRREFGGGLLGLGIAARRIPGNDLEVTQEPRKNTVMHVGGDYHSIFGGDIISKQNLEYNLRHGVKHLTAEIAKNPQGAWGSDDLQRMKDNCSPGKIIVAPPRPSVSTSG